jgi:hypothetical protein
MEIKNNKNKTESAIIQKAIIKREGALREKEELLFRKKVITIRISEPEIQKIQERMAEKEFKNMSDFMRIMAIEPQKSNKHFNLKLCYEVNKIGHNLNQLTRMCHSNRQFSKEISTKIFEINLTLGQLLKENCI